MWCFDISHWENPPPPLIRSYGWIYCAKPVWGVCLNCYFVMLWWITLGQLLFSLCFHEDLKLKKEVLWRSFEEFVMNWKFYQIKCFSFHHHNWNLTFMIQDNIYPLSSHKHKPKVLSSQETHCKENFIIPFPFSIMHPGSRLHRERTSKKTRCRCHYNNIQIIIYIGFTI